MLDDRVSRLIETIYEGAHDEGAWDRAIQGLLAQTGSYIALVCPTDLERDELFQCRYYGPDDARLVDGANEYVKELHRADPVLHFGMRNPEAGHVKLSTAVPPAKQDDVEYVRWIKDLLRIREYVVRYTAPLNGLSLAIALIPHTNREAHDDADLRLYATVFPHISHALHSVARPPMLTAQSEPTVLIDSRGRVLETSPAARDLLAEGDGLTVEGSFLRAALRGEQSLVDTALHSALNALVEGGAGGNFRLSRPSGRRPLLVRVAPLPVQHSPFDPLRAHAVVTIVDPDAAPSGRAGTRWSELFGLTPAEARLASALMTEEGSLRATAEAMGIAYATARFQLASLFDKTGVRSQAQLVRLLTRLPG